MPTRTSRPGAALTSRSSDVVCAPATLAAHSTAAATAQHDVLIRPRPTSLLRARRFSQPCAATADRVLYGNIYKSAPAVVAPHGPNHCSLAPEQIRPVATPSPARR